MLGDVDGGRGRDGNGGRGRDVESGSAIRILMVAVVAVTEGW